MTERNCVMKSVFHNVDVVLHCRITDCIVVRTVCMFGVWCSVATELLRIIKSDYLNELNDIEVDGRRIKPTKCLQWCVLCFVALSLSLCLSLSVCHFHSQSSMADAEKFLDSLFRVILSCANTFQFHVCGFGSSDSRPSLFCDRMC